MAQSKNVSRLAGFADAGSPEKIFLEVRRTLAGILPETDVKRLSRVFCDVRRLFAGSYPGYKGCNTGYHDLEHTTDVFLAMARLIRGAREEGILLDRRTVLVGLVASLLHDSGYIQRDGDRVGTGAKYTVSHIRRSVVFAREYLTARNYTPEEIDTCCNALLCTGLHVRIGRIRFGTEGGELIGKMLGAADLIGQMASRRYPEKLPHLHREFLEGKVPVPRNEHRFLADTPRFHRSVLDRLSGELDGVHRYSRACFRAHRRIDRDLYLEAIGENVARVESALRRHPKGYHAALNGTAA
jgi:hypothetical protein